MLEDFLMNFIDNTKALYKIKYTEKGVGKKIAA